MPYRGPSLPIAETSKMPLEVISHTWIRGIDEQTRTKIKIGKKRCWKYWNVFEHLAHKRLVVEIGAANRQIEHVDLRVQRIVEGVQEPGRVRYLVLGEDAKDEQRRVGCEARTRRVATGNRAGDKRAVAEHVVQLAGLVRPVETLLDVRKVFMAAAQTRVKDGHAHAGATHAAFPEPCGLHVAGNRLFRRRQRARRQSRGGGEQSTPVSCARVATTRGGWRSGGGRHGVESKGMRQLHAI